MADDTRRIEPVRGRTGETTRIAPHRHVPPRARIDLLRIASAVAGFYLLISALVALARTGFSGVTLFEPHVEVGGLDHTPLMALISLIVGVLLLAGGTGSLATPGVRFLAGVMLVIGAVWLIEPDAFHAWLGVHGENGLAYLVMGTVVFVLSFTTPIEVGRRVEYPPQG